LYRGPSGRFELHELLRQFGVEKLAGLPDLSQAIHERYVTFYIAMLERLPAELHGPRQVETLQVFEADVGNAQAAWDWAAEHGQVSYLRRGMDGLGEYYDRHKRLWEGERTFQAAAEMLKKVQGRDQRPGTFRMPFCRMASAWS